MKWGTEIIMQDGSLIEQVMMKPRQSTHLALVHHPAPIHKEQDVVDGVRDSLGQHQQGLLPPVNLHLAVKHKPNISLYQILHTISYETVNCGSWNLAFAVGKITLVYI